MGTDTQGPTDTTESLIEDLLGAATGESAETAPASTDATPDPSAQSQTETPPAAPDAPSPEGTDAPADPASPTPPETQLPIDPFAGGEPFAFRLDGRQIAPDGAKIINDHVVMPVQTWRTQMQNMLADRPAIKEREQQYRQVVSQAEHRAKIAEAKVDAMTAEIQDLFSDPAKLQAKYEHWTVEGPRIMAEMKAREAERQLAVYRERETAVQRQEHEAKLVPQMEADFGQNVVRWLAAEGISLDDKGEFPPGVEEWFQEVVEDHGVKSLYRQDTTGRWVLDDKAERLFQRGLSRFRQQQTTVKVTEQKKAMNAAAVAPGKPKTPAPTKTPAPPVNRPRDTTTGKFTKDEPFDREGWLAKRSYFEE